MKFKALLLGGLVALAPQVALATSEAEARACLAQAVADAKNGLSFDDAVARYVNIPALAARMARFTESRSWDNLGNQDKERLMQGARQYLADSENFYRVNLDTITATRGGRALGNSGAYELPGTFFNRNSDNRQRFALYIYYEDGRCYIIDAELNGLLLSEQIVNYYDF